MADEQDGRRRRKRLLTAEEKYEAWVELLAGRTTQSEVAARLGVDPTTVMKLRRTAKQGALAALSAARPGRPPKAEAEAELAEAKAEIARLSEAVKELSVENLLLRGKARWG